MSATTTGGVKFFGDNPALFANGGLVASVTSGASVASSMIDKLFTTHWRSVGSNDSTTETLIFTFASSTINRILLLDHNWKDYDVMYWNGSAYAHFTSVYGFETSLTNITETAFADDSSYYEFASVTTTKVRIRVNKTQTANAEKYLCTFMPSLELGTLSGFPGVNVSLSPRARSNDMISGLVNVVKQRKVPTVTLSFQTYPVADYAADVALMLTLIERETPFYAWPCGGRRGSTYFSATVAGYRLRDCFRVQVDSDHAAQWVDNIYSGPVNLDDLVFRGHV